jgi:hypothetical protein
MRRSVTRPVPESGSARRFLLDELPGGRTPPKRRAHGWAPQTESQPAASPVQPVLLR